jgi:hypothetical protein
MEIQNIVRTYLPNGTIQEFPLYGDLKGIVLVYLTDSEIFYASQSAYTNIQKKLGDKYVLMIANDQAKVEVIHLDSKDERIKHVESLEHHRDLSNTVLEADPDELGREFDDC